ncbi:MAG TPA: hypothetical protein PLQ36_01425 [Candidatus Gracilibacteria bacterium]|nr:hypothetical protein [Candidatus Gracilibacteria bacterium]
METSIFPNGKMETPEMENQFSQKVQPIPYKKPNIKPYKNTNKENIKENQEIQLVTNCDNLELQEAINNFIEFRKEIKKPIKKIGLNALLNNLEKLSGGDPKIKIEILEQSMANGWQGVFPVKNKDKLSENMKGILAVEAFKSQKEQERIASINRIYSNF